MKRAIKFGIWTRLLLAFGTISAITIVTGLISLLILNHSNDLFTSIMDKHLPEVIQVADFAEIGGQIIAVAPSLISAADVPSRDRIASDLDVLLQRINRQIGQMEINSPQLRNSVEVLVEGLKANLAALQSTVSRRLTDEQALTEKMERLRWLYADLIDEIEPLNQDLNYNLDAEIERLIGASLSGDKTFSARRLRDNRLDKEAIERIGDNGVLLVSLLLQAPTSVSKDQVDYLLALSDDALGVLRDSMERLTSQASSVTLRQVLAEIFALAEGDNSVFGIKKKIIAEETSGQIILAENRVLVNQLRQVIDQVVSQTRSDAFAAVTGTKTTLGRARLLLILLGIFSLLTAASVSWFYVRGNIVKRLNRLGTSMQAIASGNLQHPIPPIEDDEIGRMTRALAVFRDTAQAMEDAQAQAIIDNADVGLIIADAGGTIRFFNAMAVKLFGVQPERMVGRSLFTLILADGHEQLLRICSDVYTGKLQSAPAQTFEGLRSDGTGFPIDVSIHPVRQRNQRSLIITVHDVSERAKAQELLKKRVRQKTDHLSRINVKLRQEVQERKKVQDELVQAGKLAALGQLSTGIAHELNQPLAAIRHYLHNARLLLERDDLATHQQNLGKISELIERMAKMINHLKTFARWTTNTLEPVVLAAALEKALTLLATRIDNQQIRLQVPPIDGRWKVMAEAIRLEQVFVNIIGNAIDAVSSMPEEQRSIAVAASSAGDQIVIHINDSGPGIPEGSIDSIFDPFYTTKEVGQGLGLGLSISYNIIKDFQGHIEAGPAQGGGTRFTLTLRKAED